MKTVCFIRLAGFFPLVFLVFLPWEVMMSEPRVVTLIKAFEAGQLSRNKNPALYDDATVREARRRQIRLARLSDILIASREDKWGINLNSADTNGSWLLSCRCPKLKLQWYAYLEDYEVRLLKEEPEVSRILEDCLADDPEIVTYVSSS